MAVRIRVYPNYGGYGGYGGQGAYGYGYGMQGRLSQQQLTAERRQNSLRLQYERALWTERLKLAQLQAQLQYGGGYGGGYGWGAPGTGSFGAGMLGGMNMFGAVPGLLGAGGQSNITNQHAMGAAHQTVSNANHYSSNNYVMGGMSSPFGYGFPFGGGGGGGGLLSGLLGALI